MIELYKLTHVRNATYTATGVALVVALRGAGVILPYGIEGVDQDTAEWSSRLEDALDQVAWRALGGL